jgi:hypothetical protein
MAGSPLRRAGAAALAAPAQGEQQRQNRCHRCDEHDCLAHLALHNTSCWILDANAIPRQIKLDCNADYCKLKSTHVKKKFTIFSYTSEFDRRRGLDRQKQQRISF